MILDWHLPDGSHIRLHIPHRATPAAQRTNSKRKAAGSRRTKHHH